MKKLLLVAASITIIQSSSGQITLIDSFDPADADDLCGIGYDPDSSRVWVYGCFAEGILCYTPSGILCDALLTPGGTANDVDVEVTPESITLNGTVIPKGEVLFINGESGAAEIYAIDNLTDEVFDTLNTSFGVDHVVGGSYHPQNNTFFLVQDNVPGTVDENRIAEIDPISGDTLQTFQITSFFNVSYGDIEVGTSGNLFVVSSLEDSIAEFTAQGTFVQKHGLPLGVSSLSGIGLDCDKGEAWVSSTAGTVFHLGQFPCGISGQENVMTSAFELSEIYPNPVHSVSRFSVSMKQGSSLRLTLLNQFGQEVRLLFDGQASAGKNMFSISSEGLVQGLYLLKAENNESSVVRRIMSVR